MAKEKEQMRGTVYSLNISPKGGYEGLILRTKAEMVQVNFPQEFGDTIAELAPEGKIIDVEVKAGERRGEAPHSVYWLVNIKAGKNKTFSLDNTGEQRGIKFSGKIARLNFALHGEVNGAILDSGDFLHVKPHGAKALDLEIGLKVNGTGWTKPMVGGHCIIEADEVNGISMEKKPKSKKKK